MGNSELLLNENNEIFKIPFHSGTGEGILESEEYEDRLREIVRDLDSTSKVFPLITLFFLFILVVNPFIIEDVINGEWGYAAKPSDVVFITNILDYYNYRIFFIVFAVFLMILGSLVGMFRLKFLET